MVQHGSVYSRCHIPQQNEEVWVFNTEFVQRRSHLCAVLCWLGHYKALMASESVREGVLAECVGQLANRAA